MTIHIHSDSAIKTEHIGQILGQWVRPGMVIALDGDLGAGKTVFTRGVARGMGVLGVVRSPTYTILIEHQGEDGRPILYHFDTYRLEDEEDFIAAGLDEYLYQNAVCVIEWSNKIKTILPSQTIRVSIKGMGTDREIELTIPDKTSEDTGAIENALLPFVVDKPANNGIKE